VDVKPWEAIQGAYAGSCLVMGNGGSIAVHPDFAYPSIREAAVQRGYLQDEADVFEKFKTADFEFVLRLLWQADIVNQALQLQEPRVQAAYATVRTALIRTLRDVHVEHGALGDSPFTPPEQRQWVLPSMNTFLANFNLVVSLNYDLLVYWARMAQNIQASRDCFNYTEEGQLEFEGLPGQLAPQISYFVYPHGSLCLVRDRYGQESKLKSKTANLLDVAITSWESGNYIPLFVSEGSSEHKRRAIQASPYLSAAYAAIGKPTQSNALVVYGWGLADQDKHILNALKARKPARIAVSVYDASAPALKDLVHRISSTFGVEPDLFAYDSVGAWSQRTARMAALR
jgi:hypothetical protein